MKVHVLRIPYHSSGNVDFLFPVLLQQGREIFLVDCGYEDSFSDLEKAAEEQGVSLSQVTGILLTHHDIDHVAGAFPFTKKYPAVPVYASAIEANYISGKAKSLRLQQAEDMDACLPKEQKPAARAFIAMLQRVKPVPVDHILDARSDWPLAGEVEVIPTPGHTPGHLSLYVKKQKTLIAADAVVIQGGRLKLANPQFALDLPKAIASVSKLREFDSQKLICYHGGVLCHNVQEALDELIMQLQKGNVNTV